MELGISRHDGRIFMGRRDCGFELSAMPMISPCKFVKDKAECVEGPETNSRVTGFMFLEDYFDPKSRIRRGRVYKANESQGHPWTLRDGTNVECDTYVRTSVWAQYLRDGDKHLQVLLGDEKRYTRWKLINVEVVATGEEMLTIKALKSFGFLPDLLESEIPEGELEHIQRALDLVADEMHTASADSVVDGCREAASEILAAFSGHPNNDLGKLVGLLDKEPYERYVAHKCAAIINRFHPRRKASERRRRALRRLSDEEAQLAVQCLGTILVELGWAHW